MSENIEEVKTEEVSLLNEGTPEVKTEETKVEEKKVDTSTTLTEYTDFKFPDGIVANEAQLNEFKPIAQELKLTQEQAQKLVDLQTKYSQEAQKSQEQNWVTTVDGWRKDAQTDKEYGGTAFKDNIVFAKTALDKFGTPELRDALNVTGAGNHPEFIRFMYRVGKAISEDKIHSGEGGKNEPRSQAKILYPDMN